ncbi:MAG: ribosome small subunit-dependent GTPase A [Bacteroidetes Order II. Incertae sedis bacterium]|nr:ribosome small subunit-dependent GTPase A [Bacteroidetes Order II. bacterium]
MKGIVLRSTGSRHSVWTEEGLVSCTIRGKFRLTEEDATNPVVIGDRVEISKNEDESGVITERFDRATKLSRRAAGRREGKEHVIIANVDTAWVVQSIRDPRINPGFIDRFLVMSEASGIGAGIVFNKADLLDDAAEEVVGYFARLYASLGYEVVFTSTMVKDGLSELRECLREGIHVFVGPSGVGKSSLLNGLLPDADLKTGAISEATNKGKHTTTYAELIPIPEGGYVGDTPGLREFGLYEVEAAELSHYFVEYRPHMHDCKFPNCTHDHEPACEIKRLVDEGDLSIERYESYINMLNAARLGDQDVGR